jgi:hypothetical protein
MEAHPHLRFEREQHINERRPSGYPPVQPPQDIPKHAGKLRGDLASTRSLIQDQEIPGFDSRLLFKLQIGTLSPEQIEQGLPGVEILSQEDGGFALAFATEQALENFEARLASLIEGGRIKYPSIIYALQALDMWSPLDRTGWALKEIGSPGNEPFYLDVELWPLELQGELASMRRAFEAWLKENQIQVLDNINQPGLVAYRVKTDSAGLEKILHYRDVRLADLPPKAGIDNQLLRLDIQDISNVPAPSDDAPLVAVLDSGIASSHPLLAPAIGDARGFLPEGDNADDEHGHGTLVAGIALYDDVEACALSKQFIPQIRLLSGRILDANGNSDSRFIENIVDEAVRYFYENYGCRIFNLSYGDLNKPYQGGRVRGLAYTLDRLSRELDVLFVVPTGNIIGPDLTWVGNYPDYINEHGPLIDPAPALNVLTVGSIARYDLTNNSVRRPQDVAERPIARLDQPSPFTRSGPSVKGAIKPEIVAYGGNQALGRSGMITAQGLGELSTNKDFASGRVLSQICGTSFAAPHISHLAARLLYDRPDAGVNLIRALMIANAKIPSPSFNLLGNDYDRAAQLVGYGSIDVSGIYRSTEDHILLIAESRLINKHNHFYEIPIPDSFYNEGKRSRRREITVALAHCPPVRTTRIDYKASRFTFKLIKAANLEEAVASADKETRGESETNSELGGEKYAYGSRARSQGTVQATTWAIKRSNNNRLFVIVTRNDPGWGGALTNTEEPYALVIRMVDREYSAAKLYTQVKAKLQAREQARPRVRI